MTSLIKKYKKPVEAKESEYDLERAESGFDLSENNHFELGSLYQSSMKTFSPVKAKMREKNPS